MSTGIDCPPVSGPSEAEALCTYHLKMAAAYFEATDLNLCKRLPADEFSHPAMAAWTEAMEALYTEEG